MVQLYIHIAESLIQCQYVCVSLHVRYIRFNPLSPRATGLLRVASQIRIGSRNVSSLMADPSLEPMLKSLKNQFKLCKFQFKVSFLSRSLHDYSKLIYIILHFSIMLINFLVYSLIIARVKLYFRLYNSDYSHTICVLANNGA